MDIAGSEFSVVRSLEAPATSVVKVAGEIDLYTVDRFTRGLVDALTCEGVKTVVVDMAAVTFMDSSGLGVLVGAFKQGANRDIGVVLRSPSRRVMEVLEMTGLRSVLRVVSPSGEG